LKWIALTLFCVVLLGCHHAGYQKDRSFKAIHIFGLGWLMEKVGTNKVRAFAIGSLDATSLAATTQTNAPFTMQRATNKVDK
jgi:hypothetical protein